MEKTIEEKAKAFDEALDKAKQFSEKPYLEDSKSIVEYLFPELKESEGENIFRKLIAFLKQCKAVYGSSFKQFDIDIDAAIAWLEKQKSSWSEEDEQYLLVCKNALAKYQVSDKWDATIISRWLEYKIKSLRSQNNATDEELAQAKKDAYNDALDKIEYYSGEPTFDDGWSAAIWYLKKKNARPQSTWKPSDEQMEYLAKAITTLGDEGDCKTALILNDLRFELKKLREE